MRSSPISRRIIGAVATAGITFILDRFGQMPSAEAAGVKGLQELKRLQR
jgi:hypothetical protein